ncbi:hypothetical protein ACA910_016281 [Epithemia clementina (nom. ined.)]
MDADVSGHEDQVDDEDAKLTISEDQVFDGLPVPICPLMTSRKIVSCETNSSKSINLDAEYKSTKHVSDDLSTYQENVDADIKDDVSVSTLDISLCQAYEEIFGDGDVPNMVVPLTTYLFQQPFYLQSSEYEVDFIPPLDIQLYQAYEEIFGDHDVFTMLLTSDKGIFHQPFHLQQDEYEVEFDIGQGHESKRTENGEHQLSSFTCNAVEHSAFPSFTICHDLGEINQVDGETHPGPDGETHLELDEETHILKDMINQIDGETHLCNKDICKQDIVKQVDGETHLHKLIINHLIVLVMILDLRTFSPLLLLQMVIHPFWIILSETDQLPRFRKLEMFMAKKYFHLPSWFTPSFGYGGHIK